jgi:anti-sigma-K factor RskA
MIDEQQHDLAIEYLFGHLEGDAQREFEAWLQSDDEMRTLVDELRETTAALALSAPQQQPPPHLRAKILAIARGETDAAVTAPAHRRLGWIPWAIAAGLAIVGIFLQTDRERWRRDASNARAEIARALAATTAVRDQLGRIDGRLQLSEAQAKTHLDQISELRDEVVKLRGRDALAQVKIATLTAQVTQYARAGVIIVWDPEEQRGVARIINLPKPGAGKDYQLWVIDPKYPAPVSGGVLTVADAGQTRVAFRPDQLIEHADKFAISIEQAGGVAAAAGPIIFVGE